MNIATYSRSTSEQIVTITSRNHNLVPGNWVYCDFRSSITDGSYMVMATPTADTFQVCSSTNTPVTGNVNWLKTGLAASLSGSIATGATFSRSSTTITVTYNSHGRSNGDIVYIVWLGSAHGQSNGYFTVAGSTTNTFTVTGVASGTTPGGLSFVLASATSTQVGATFSQSGTTITITKISHGLTTTDSAALAFAGAKVPVDRVYSIDSTPTSDTFTVTADAAVASLSGGVQVGSGAITASVAHSMTTYCNATSRLVAVSGVLSSRLESRANGYPVFQAVFGSLTHTLSAKSIVANTLTRTVQVDLNHTLSARCSPGRTVPLEVVLSHTLSSLCNPQPESVDINAYPARALLSSTITLNARVRRAGLTVTDILDDLAGLSYIPTARQAPEHMKVRMLTDLNAGLVMLYSRSAQLDYFNRARRNYLLEIGASSLTLEDDVQCLHGYVRTTDGANIPFAKHRSEIDRAAAITGDSSGLQMVYALRHRRSHAQAFTHEILIGPPVTEVTTIYIDVLLDAPVYAWTDYVNFTRVRVPHNYAQLIQALTRYSYSSSSYFQAAQQLPRIQADYEQARVLLGAVDLAPVNAAPGPARTAKLTA